MKLTTRSVHERAFRCIHLHRISGNFAPHTRGKDPMSPAPPTPTPLARVITSFIVHYTQRQHMRSWDKSVSSDASMLPGSCKAASPTSQNNNGNRWWGEFQANTESSGPNDKITAVDVQLLRPSSKVVVKAAGESECHPKSQRLSTPPENLRAETP